MGEWTVFDHTADLGLSIRAVDLDDLFRTAAEALFAVIVTRSDAIQLHATEQISLAADSPEALLLDWLNELIFRFETGHHVFGRFDVHVAPDGLSLEADARGEPLDPDRHGLDHEVKAATHHGATLARDQGRGDWHIEVILDI